jgi:hypothetical protein
MRAISPEQLSELLPAEDTGFRSPIPTQIMSSDEYLPAPQTEEQREVEARLKEIGATLARRQGMSRRRFFQTAAGMAASYNALPSMLRSETLGVRSRIGHSSTLPSTTRPTATSVGRRPTGSMSGSSAAVFPG